jgi:hypothetical protein
MRSFPALAALLLASVSAAQDLTLARAAARIDSEIPWITDGFYAADPGRPVATLPKTTVDRNKLLDQALQRAADEKKLVFWYIPRIEGGHMVRPEFLDTYMRVVAFTDGPLAQIINERFVPLRMAVDGPISKRMGITKLDWVEPAIVILGPEGKMLHRLDRIRTFDAGFLSFVLIEILEKHPELASLPEGLKAAVERAAGNTHDYPSAEQTAARALGVGWLSGAERVLQALLRDQSTGKGTHAWSHILLALISEMRRDEASAIANLDAAEGLAPELHRAWILTARGRLALAAGDLIQAQGLLGDAAGREDNQFRAEAMYNLAVARVLDNQPNAGEEFLREIVTTFANDKDQWRWAAKAAANLIKGRDTTPVGPLFHGFEDPTALPVGAFAESRPNTACSRPVSDRDSVVKNAVAFLLRRQGGHGGFEDSRYAYCDSPRILPNVWVAVTAIALAGLNDWREIDPKRIDDAIARGEEYLFDETRLARGRNEECYADSFRLVYLARRLPRLTQGSEETKRAQRLMKAISKRLAAQQTESGFWAHEYPNPFSAAAALLALKQVEGLGTAVPPSVFESGARALRSVRGERGTFAYGAGRPTGRENDGAFKNAMARMPACERVLLFSDENRDPAALEAALDNFWKWLPRFERIRTCDFHSDGELGGFFFWHGMFLTSESIQGLDPEKRGPHERRMLEHVMSIGEIDGSFVDSHEVGKSYGTGMALMILRNCAGRGP